MEISAVAGWGSEGGGAYVVVGGSQGDLVVFSA